MGRASRGPIRPRPAFRFAPLAPPMPVGSCWAAHSPPIAHQVPAPALQDRLAQGPRLRDTPVGQQAQCRWHQALQFAYQTVAAPGAPRPPEPRRTRYW
jgi:hypothetical protein